MTSNLVTPKLKLYETVFVLTPVLTTEQTSNIVQKFKNFLSNTGAKILYEQAVGLKKLAYPIQHKTTGFYQILEFSAMSNVIIELERAYRQDESVIRFLTCEMDKHAVAYKEQQRGPNIHPHTTHSNDVVDNTVGMESTSELK